MRNCLKIALALIALGLVGTSSSFAQNRANPYPNGADGYSYYNYAPGYGTNYANPRYVPGYGDTEDRF
jgi:hypothetical protein